MGLVIAADVEEAIMSIPQVYKADAVLVFDPPWDSDMMTEEAKLELLGCCSVFLNTTVL